MLSEDEQRRWRELSAELAQERQLVGLSKRLAQVGVGAGLSSRTWLTWLVGGISGAVLLLAGGVTGDAGLLTVGVGLLVVTTLLTGALLIAAGIGDCRSRPPSPGGHPEGT